SYSDLLTTNTYTLSLHDALPIYDRDGPQLQTRGGQPQQVRGDPIELAHQHPDDLGPGRGLDPEQPLHRQAVAQLVEERRQVVGRSEEHTSELQSRVDLVCRLLLE